MDVCGKHWKTLFAGDITDIISSTQSIEILRTLKDYKSHNIGTDLHCFLPKCGAMEMTIYWSPILGRCAACPRRLSHFEIPASARLQLRLPLSETLQQLADAARLTSKGVQLQGWFSLFWQKLYEFHKKKWRVWRKYYLRYPGRGIIIQNFSGFSRWLWKVQRQCLHV